MKSVSLILLSTLLSKTDQSLLIEKKERLRTVVISNIQHYYVQNCFILVPLLVVFIFIFMVIVLGMFLSIALLNVMNVYIYISAEGSS